MAAKKSAPINWSRILINAAANGAELMRNWPDFPVDTGNMRGDTPLRPSKYSGRTPEKDGGGIIGNVSRTSMRIEATSSYAVYVDGKINSPHYGFFMKDFEEQGVMAAISEQISEDFAAAFWEVLQ